MTFGDYWKLGLPSMALFLAAVFVVPLISALVTPAPAPGPRSAMS